MGARFSYASALTRPEDVRPFLADPQKHWVQGRSAHALATRWIGAGGLPSAVRSVIASDPVWEGAELAEGFFERETPLETPGRPSQTDLMAFCRLPSGGLGVMAVEGKAGEAFGPIVRDWNTTPGRERRLRHLADLLTIETDVADRLRWQLFHRTAAAVLEAERWGCRQAVMLVHAFTPSSTSERDFVAFASAARILDARPGRLAGEITARGVRLCLGWVYDSAP